MTNSRKAQPLDFDVDGLEVDEGLGVRRRMVGGGSGNETLNAVQQDGDSAVAYLYARSVLEWLHLKLCTSSYLYAGREVSIMYTHMRTNTSSTYQRIKCISSFA